MGGLTVVGLPVYSLARYAGVARAPEALRIAGLIAALGPLTQDLGDVQLPELKENIIQEGVKNMDHIRLASDKIFERTRTLDPSRDVVCIGGECSMILGSLAGLSEIFEGKPGLVWMDAHGDFNIPESSPSGYIGGMCLAMVAGRGPRLSEAIELHRPLADEQSLVHIGSRALDEEEERMMLSSGMRLIPMAELRRQGSGRVATEASRILVDRADWLVCHLDVDVIDPSLIPAVNYPERQGMTVEEAVSIVRVLKGTGRLRVVEVAAYNPSLDADGASARTVAELVSNLFA